MPRPIADYSLPVPVLPYYAHFNTRHLFLFLIFIRKNTLTTEQDLRQSATAKSFADLGPWTDESAHLWG